MPSSAPTPARPPENEEYILGTGEQESARLGLQHRLWAASAHVLWERAGILPGMTILDVGCGPGHATMDLAEIAGPRGHVYAVDESALFLKQLHDRAAARQLRNVERILGDAQQIHQLLPHLLAKADFAYARWVLCFVPDPEAVVAGVAALLKRGGCIAIQDYFSYESMTLAPRRDAFSRGVQAIGRSWRDRGGDPDIAARLPGLLRQHGLEVTYLNVNQRVATPDSTIWQWPDSFWQNYLPRLVEMGYLTGDEAAAFEAAWAQAASDPDSFMMLPPVWDIIARKR
jgi:ubiquinone/menaquinone biosynthesis C-methylase UbiE